MQWPISGLGCFFHTRGSDYDNLYKIVISNTFRQFKIDTKCHLVNVWSNFDLVILRYINNKKKTWSAQIYFSKSFFSRANTFLEKLFFVRSMFSCVRTSYDLCVRAHAHSLEGTLVPSHSKMHSTTRELFKNISGPTLSDKPILSRLCVFEHTA